MPTIPAPSIFTSAYDPDYQSACLDEDYDAGHPMPALIEDRWRCPDCGAHAATPTPAHYAPFELPDVERVLTLDDLAIPGRVAAGMALLTTSPATPEGWRERLTRIAADPDTDLFDIDNPVWCVLAHLFGGYGRGQKALGFYSGAYDDNVDPGTFGFAAVSARSMASYESAALTAEWRRVLLAAETPES